MVTWREKIVSTLKKPNIDAEVKYNDVRSRETTHSHVWREEQ